MSHCRTIRQRPAPSADRTAISSRRATPSASSRPATFAQAIRRTRRTTPCRMSTGRPTPCRRVARTGSTRIPHPLLVKGVSAASVAAIPFSSHWAWWRATS